MKKALIIFVRKPELGKVKTRLAATIGVENALEIYVQLLEHTHQISTGVDADKFVFYVNSVVDDDLWSSDNYVKKLQSGNDLGDKMCNACSGLFDEGYNQIVIIGSDCPELKTTLIKEAFEMLLQNDIVLGPATDGGYYLIGMKKLRSEIFCNIEWSTEKVLAQTLEACESAGLSNKLLPVLTDIDTEEDLKTMQHLFPPKSCNMISIIIPTYNEADEIKHTIKKVHELSAGEHIEIIISDGGSTDETKAIAKACGVKRILSKRKGRAAQMNAGAQIASGNILYFLHADSIPPKGFINQILRAYEKGAKSGCFRLAFDHDHWFLKANAWFTRFDVNGLRFGDQSLYVVKDVFEKCGGFLEDMVLMEDQEIIHRIKNHGRFIVMNNTIITSARKYIDNGIFRMQGIFFRIWLLYYMGYSQERLLKLYRKLTLNHKQ